MRNEKQLKLSLIVTTFNREKELKRFIDSLSNQMCDLFEIILINQGNISDDIRKNFKNNNWEIIDIGHQIPLSVARNLGLKIHNGKYIGFPDDDCWYMENFIDDIITRLDNLNEYEAICVSVYDPIMQVPYGQRPRNIRKELSYRNVIQLPVSVGIFIKSKFVLDHNLQFNEKLGAGTYYGGGEETEFLCNVLKHKKKIIYDGFLTVYHEVDNYQLISIDKVKKYSRGYGYIIGGILRNKNLQVLPSILFFLIKSVGGLLIRSYNRKYFKIYYTRIIYFFFGVRDAFADNNLVF